MSPLSTKTRKRVLYVLFALFIILTPVLIGYSKGYRLDDALSLIQTGGIYLHSDVANTSVYIDDEFIENNGAFLRNTLVQNLLPNKHYTLRVEHDMYQTWQKTLLVQPKLVTEARVLMLPKTFTWEYIYATSTLPQESTTTNSTTTKATSSDVAEKKVINPEFTAMLELFENTEEQFAVDVATSTYEYIRGVRHATTTTVTEIRFPLWFNDVASTSVLHEKDMVRERSGIITWLDQGDLFAVWGKEDVPHPYFFCTKTCKEQLVINWQEDIVRYEFYPNREDVVLILNEKGLYAVELDNRSQRNIHVIIEEPNLDFRLLSDGSVVVYDGTSFRITKW